MVIALSAYPQTGRAGNKAAFIQNDGQWPDTVAFMNRQGDTDIWFTRRGWTISVFHFNEVRPHEPEYHRFATRIAEEQSVGHSILRVQFRGTSPTMEIVGEGLTNTYYNYFLGQDTAAWASHVPLYERIRYTNLYPGIDVLYDIDRDGLKYDFIVAPGADPSRIIMRYEGADSIGITAEGDLRIEAPNIVVYERYPVAWQIRGGLPIPVEVSYLQLDDRSYGFEVADYDSSLPLMIDPPVELVYSTYLGGSGREYGNSLANLPDGCLIVVGSTRSSDYPVQNPYQDSLAGNSDALISKFSPDGSQLLYSTYLGGEYPDAALDIDLGISGEICLTGYTSSTDFPLMNPYQNDQGGRDAFISVLSPDGSELLYSTYLGATETDAAEAIQVASSGAMVIAGDTESPDFPLMNPYQPLYGGGPCDAFITCFSAQGDSLLFSTFLGGYTYDEAYDLFVDDSDYLYLVGRTSSDDIPFSGGGYQSSNAGSVDAFAAKLAPDGSQMIYGTYLGGSGWDNGWGLAVHQGCLLLAGNTESLDFPVLYAYQDSLAGGPSGDAFLSKLDESGSQLVYSTYFGGSGSDGFLGLDVDDGGSAFCTGTTHSEDLPLLNPFQSSYGGDCDAVVARFTPWGSELFWSTYLGGAGDDAGVEVLVDAAGNAFIVGDTYSSDFPMQNPYQSGLLGTCDAFLSQFGPEGTAINEGYRTRVQEAPSWTLRPNPFREILGVRIFLKKASTFSILAFDSSGRLVDVIHHGALNSGDHLITWVPRRCPPGVYLIRMIAGDTPICTDKVVLLE